MKSLVLCVLVAVSQAAVLKTEYSPNLPAPKLLRLVAIEPMGFKIEWEPVKSKDPAEPVTGYTVKVWEQQSKRKFSYQNVEGVDKLVEDVVYAKLPKEDIPDFEPTELDVAGADSASIEFKNIKEGIEYEVRIQAYSSKGKGPLSKFLKIKVG